MEYRYVKDYSRPILHNFEIRNLNKKSIDFISEKKINMVKMTNLQRILIEEQLELKEIYNWDSIFGKASEAERKIKNFIQSYNQKIIQEVCEEIRFIGENAIVGHNKDWQAGYTQRLQEEINKATLIINETKL